ncbi:sulfatase family protein [Thalassoroseus pseudoceratinae]|uniref:sulfatase family protein n=1 Tax=Thalassoroseus pseudoceratinae TaxID=2713176 RepID=UPI00142297BE|nr:sulfatase [Thalassoroseus pseudoceratinae]
MRYTRHTGCWLVVSIFLATLGSHVAASSPPNILFAIADDWSYGHASAYGCNWVKTPGFDRVAHRGILFTHAYTPNAKCAPSRACILTGRNSWQLEEAANHWCDFPAKFKGFMESLAENGYSTGSTGKGWGPGIAKDANGRHRLMTGPKFSKRKAKPPARSISNNDYAGNFADFLAQTPSEKPWIFWYGATEPHRGYEYGSGQRHGKSIDDIEHVPAYWPDNETVRNDMLDYAVEVEHFDAHLVRILNLLEEQNQLENTLVVVTSDHGMPFPRVKGQAYDDSNRIPLAMCWPKGIKGKGRKVDDYISFIDLAPTFLEVAGISWEDSQMAKLTGHSLSDVFQSDQSGKINPNRDHVLIGKERHDIGRPNDWGYPIRGIIRDEKLYIRNFEADRWPAGNPETGYLNCDGGPTKTEVLDARRKHNDDLWWKMCFGHRPTEELYDVYTDPDCVKNLSNVPSFQSVKNELTDELLRRLKEQNDPRVLGNGEIFDRYLYASPGGRNFHQRFRDGEKLNAGWVNASDFEKEAPTSKSKNP